MQITRSTMRRAAVAVLLLGAGLTTVAGVASPAQAEESSNRCTATRHGDTDGFTTVGGASTTLTGDGVLLSTGTTSDADRVDWKTTFAHPVDADTVTEATYTTTKQDTAGADVNDAALTAYRFFVRIGGADGVLIYEPYWNTVGNPPRGVETTWNVLTGKLWTSSTTIPGLPKTAGGPPEKTFAQVRADNPDMLVTGIGLGLGTYNRGTKSLTNDVHFKGGAVCVTHEWSTRFVKPTPTSTVTATPTQTPVGNPACNTHYPQVCLTHDVNCTDIQQRNFTVVNGDPYGLDADKDGIACEDKNKPTPYLPGVALPTTTAPTPSATTSSPAGSLAVTPADYSQGQLTGTVVLGLLLLVGGTAALLIGRKRRRNA